VTKFVGVAQKSKDEAAQEVEKYMKEMVGLGFD